MTTQSAIHEGALRSFPSSIRIGPIALPRRMAVVTLPSGGLWVHTPNELTDAVRAELDALGPVRHVVAPTKMHTAYLDDWRRAFPAAQFWGAPGFAQHRPKLHVDRELGDVAPPEFEDVFEQRVLPGAPRLDEVLFLHRPSRTLVVADLVFHVGAEAPFATRLMMRLNGAYARFTPTRIFRSVCEDRAAVRRAVLDLCAAWDFDAVHMSHGEPVTSGARERLRAAFESFS
ncbi:MAG: DUF4336 domain-containing protein [Planctomycetota bacterium]